MRCPERFLPESAGGFYPSTPGAANTILHSAMLWFARPPCPQPGGIPIRNQLSFLVQAKRCKTLTLSRAVTVVSASFGARLEALQSLQDPALSASMWCFQRAIQALPEISSRHTRGWVRPG